MKKLFLLMSVPERTIELSIETALKNVLNNIIIQSTEDLRELQLII